MTTQAASTSSNNLQVLAYSRLSSYFRAHDDQVIEVEILPPAIQPPDGLLLTDGLSLGIPKKILALAYVEARKQFFENAEQGDIQSLALLATKVMLLFDPEHLTATNFRKRRLVKLKATNCPDTQATYHDAVQHEFCFLNSILTSPLHRQSKSPNLWHHRLWLLDLYGPTDLQLAPEGQSVKFWRKELDVVCTSGQQHPKNYYAWQYARRLMRKINSEDVVLDFAVHVKNWCCKHPSDTSGWSFLVHILSLVSSSTERQNLIRDVLNYAIHLQCENESMWVFVRTILAHKSLQEHERVELMAPLLNFSKALEDSQRTSALSQRVTTALDWIRSYGIRKALLDSL